MAFSIKKGRIGPGRIGTQIWMLKNLDVDTYRNGDIIPQVTDPINWDVLTTGAWCWYNDDPANGDIYGKLYNWAAVTDPRGLAPVGWHIPSFNEWTTLRTFVNSNGGELKATGTTYWSSPNSGATNSTRFTGLPGGLRYGGNNNDYGLNIRAFFWSSTEADTSLAYSFGLVVNSSSTPQQTLNKVTGLSVRCIKD